MRNKNVQHIINALARINHELAKGPNYHGAHQLKLLRKAHAKYSRQLEEFTNPKAPARSLPVRPQDFAARSSSSGQRSLFNR